MGQSRWITSSLSLVSTNDLEIVRLDMTCEANNDEQMPPHRNKMTTWGLKDRSRWTPPKIRFVEVRKFNGGTLSGSS